MINLPNAPALGAPSVIAPTVTSTALHQESHLEELDAIYAAAPVGIAFFDPDFRFVRINDRLARINGAPSTAHVGRTIEEVLPQETSIVLRAIQPRLLAGEAVSEIEISRPDEVTGSLRSWQVSLRPVLDRSERVRGFVAMVLDVTAQKQVKLARVESDDRVRRVLDSLFAFVGVLETDGTLIEANSAPLAAGGLTIDDVRGRKFWDCYWWSYDPAVQEALREAVARAGSGEVVRYDVDVRLAGGHMTTIDFQIAPLMEAGRIRYLVPSGIDISERKRVEGALRKSEERLMSALRAGELGVHDFDPRSGRIEGNETFRSLWGLRPDEPVVYDLFTESVHPDDRARVAAAVEAALDPGGNGRYVCEYRIRKLDDGEERWVFADGDVTFENGVAVRLVGTVRDITERKRQDEHMQLLMHELAHRSKNLLAVIKSMVRQTAAHTENMEAFTAKLDARITALSAAHDLLIDQNWTGADLHDLIEAQLSPFVDIAAGQVRIVGPSLQLRPQETQHLALALHELATNSCKYGALSAEGGTVSIDWSLGPVRNSRASFAITWIERGGPPVHPPTRRGFGTMVVQRLAPLGLNGAAECDYRPEGLIWRFKTENLLLRTTNL